MRRSPAYGHLAVCPGALAHRARKLRVLAKVKIEEEFSNGTYLAEYLAELPNALALKLQHSWVPSSIDVGRDEANCSSGVDVVP